MRAYSRDLAACARAAKLPAVLALLAIASVGSAQDVDPLIAARSSDPIELARVVDRIGDEGVIARLTDETSAAVRLAAIRATRAMDAPERALVPLAVIASGRDPDLAPAAALALLAIARELDPQALDGREVMRAELVPARSALAVLAADETARADLRRAAAVVLDALAQLGLPET